MSRFATHRAIILLSTISILAACDDAKDSGTDTDGTSGEQYQGSIEDQGTQRSRSAGSVDLSSATMVQAWTVTDDGESEMAGESELDVSGSFSIQTSADAEDSDLSVIHALDASGTIIASAIVEEAGTDADSVFNTRIDVESTIEAWAFLDRVEAEGDAAAANYADIRSRIDAGLAASVYLATGEGDGAMAALNASLSAAASAALQSHQDSGFDGDQSDLYTIMAAASQSLDASISASGSPEDIEAAYADFFASVDAALDAEGIDAEDRYSAEAAAALAFELALSSMIESGSDVEDSGGQASSALLADAAADLITSLAADDEMDAASGDLLVEAAAELVASMDSAASEEDAEAAWAQYTDEVMVGIESMLHLEGSDKDKDGDLLDDLFGGELGDVFAALVIELETIFAGTIDGGEGSADDAVALMTWLEASIHAAVAVSAEGSTDGEIALMSEVMFSTAGSYILR